MHGIGAGPFVERLDRVSFMSPDHHPCAVPSLPPDSTRVVIPMSVGDDDAFHVRRCEAVAIERLDEDRLTGLAAQPESTNVTPSAPRIA